MNFIKIMKEKKGILRKIKGILTKLSRKKRNFDKILRGKKRNFRNKKGRNLVI